MQRDNSTLLRKLALRRRVLRAAPGALVLETHGGYGRVWERVWYGAPGGVVIEKDRDKAEFLAQQRPEWRVYLGDCVSTLAAGLAADLPFGIVDLDPYGSPFETLKAFFAGRVGTVPVLQLVVNDGLRQKTKVRGSWNTHVLAGAVQRHGNNLHPIYLQVAREIVTELAAAAGYRVTHFEGYYCGFANDMTHYWATLTAQGSSSGL